jgi:DNA polymerase III sliding clamp (beta) subunit (PCNA family)
MCEIKKAENQDEFERALFVCKARATDKNRQSLNVVHVERTKSGSHLVATDGRRLHVTEIGKRIPSGDYQPVITKDSIAFGQPLPDSSFPNWARVVPGQADTVRKGVLDLANTGIGRTAESTEKLSAEFGSFVRKTGTAVNLRYLEDLTKTDWVVCAPKEKGKALLLKQKSDPDKIFAVIMPLRDAA